MAKTKAIATRPGDTDLDKILENTPANYRYQAGEFIGFLRDNGMTLDDETAWTAYLDQVSRVAMEGPRAGQKYAASTYNSRVDAMCDRVKYALAKSPAIPFEKRFEVTEALKRLAKKRITRKAVGVGADKVLSVGHWIPTGAGKNRNANELEDLVACAGANGDPYAHEVATMIAMLFHTAARISELLDITVRDCKARGDHYEITLLGKGNKERTVFAPAEIVERVLDKKNVYLFTRWTGRGKKRHPDKFKRQFASMRITRAGELCLHREISAHTLRHTWATWFYEKTKDIVYVSQVLGHSDVKITQRLYVHSVPTWESQREIMATVKL